MGNVHYMISEAAKQVNVETHVLRYWEDELSLVIGRTEMGHRYYTKEDIQLFCCIKELKEQGLQLKELKSLIPDMIQTKNRIKVKKETSAPNIDATNPENPDEMDKLSALKILIQEAMREVITDNNDTLSNTVIKNMDFLLQAKERNEEERYRNLDQLIRHQQLLRKESAKVSPFGRFKKVLET